MKWIRASGFVLSKVMKSLFERVNVNSDGVEKIRPLFTKYPVIFMPSHRSYMDFLLMSYVLFQYSLPCPVICAAQVCVRIWARTYGKGRTRTPLGSD